MERTEINKEDQWDLSLIYKNNQDFYKDLEDAKNILSQLILQKETFLTSVENFLEFHNDYTQLSIYITKLHCFAHLHCDVEPNNQDYQTM